MNMTPKERFETTISMRTPDRVPVFPKIWIDLAAKIMGVEFIDLLNDPFLCMKTTVDAARKLGMDAARLFTFPFRNVEFKDNSFVHVNKNGRALGQIDIQGGWATHYKDNRDIDISENNIMISHHYLTDEPLVSSMEDIQRIGVPDSAYYEHSGYGAMIESIKKEAGDQIALLGDCDSGTLAHYVALRGMETALIDFYDNPSLVHSAMGKGIQYSLERAKFFIRHDIKIMRYNDSVANMSVISPPQWREFIFPHLKELCEQIHAMDHNARVYCHICGNILPIANDMVLAGLDCIAPLDPMQGMTVAQVRSSVGDNIVLMGGVNTMSLLRGNPEEIIQESENCIIQGASKGRFILGSGCVVPRNTNVENLIAMRESAERYGKYMHEYNEKC